MFVPASLSYREVHTEAGLVLVIGTALIGGEELGGIRAGEPKLRAHKIRIRSEQAQPINGQHLEVLTAARIPGMQHNWLRNLPIILPDPGMSRQAGRRARAPFGPGLIKRSRHPRWFSEVVGNSRAQ